MSDRSRSRLDAVPPGLATFLVDVRAGLDFAIADARARPDFEDVLVRAGEAGPRAPAPDRASNAADARLDDVPAGLGQFVDDVRSFVATSAHERRLKPVPPLRSPWGPARWLSRSIVVAGVAAAAGLAALWLGGLGTRATDRPHDAAPSAAMADREPVASESAVSRVPAPVKPHRSSPPTNAGDTLELDEIQILDDVAPMPAPAPGSEAGTPKLDDLEAAAAEAWARGALREAESALEQIVRRGGRTRQAELAFGDLFTIAYQRRDAPQQLELWRRYLKRFPRGRYADDARAGVCRMAAAADVRASCWTRYLADWPRGSHRDEARKHAGPP